MKPLFARLGSSFAADAPSGQRLRSALAGVLCLLGIWLYATVVGRSYPLHEWLFWRLAAIWLYGALFALSTLTLGHAVLTRLIGADPIENTDGNDHPGLPFAETLTMSVAIGVLAFCLAMIGAGALGIIGPTFSMIMPFAFIAIGARRLPGLVRQARAWWASRPPTTLGYSVLRNLALAFGVVCLFLLYVQSMTPTAINYDASWYHMPVAEDYARTGKIFPMYGDYNRSFPQLPSMLHTWAFSVPGLIPQLRWMLALQGEFLLVIWTIVGVVAGAEYMLRRRVRGLWPVFFLFPSIFVYDQNIGGSADHILGFWAIPMALATVRLLVRFERRWAILLGIAAAGAILSKLQAIYMIFACTIVIATRFFQFVVRRVRKPETADAPPWRTLIASPLWVIGVAALLTSPHFIKNVLFYGNPLHPFAQRHFPVWPVHENTYLYFDEGWALETILPKGSTSDKIVNAIKLYFTYSFHPHRALNHNWPMLGSLYTLLLPTALLMKGTGRFWLFVVLGFFSFFLWGYTYPNDRYLHCLLPLTYAMAAFLIVRVWEFGLWARVGLVPLVAFQIVWGADTMFYSGHKRMEAAVDMFRSGYENKRKDKDRFPWRARELQIRDALPKDAVVLGRNYKATVGIDRYVLSDVQSFQSIFHYAALTSVRDLWEQYKAQGVTHLLYPPGKRDSDVVKADVLFAELVYRHAKKKKKFPGLELVWMPEEPPPPDERGYRVLAVGLRAYPNGLYDLEQFTVYERLNKSAQHEVDPKEPVKSVKAAVLLPLLARVDAVVVGKSGRLDGETKKALEKEFVAAEKYDVHTIWLRKDRSKRAD